MLRILLLLCVSLLAVQAQALRSDNQVEIIKIDKNYKKKKLFAPLKFEVKLGSTFVKTFQYSADAGTTVTFTSPTFSNVGIGISILSDNCTGQVIPGPFVCEIKVQMIPTSTSMVTAQYYFHTQVQYGDSGYGMDEEYNFVLWGIDIPNNSANPPAPRCSESRKGSFVNVDAQSLGERVPIVGTDFSLVYSSEHSSSYSTSYPIPSIASASFRPNGWTLDIMNFYEQKTYRVFKGTGGSEVRENLDPNSMAVVNAKGTEIYQFNVNGRHAVTNSALTNSSKYIFTYDTSDRLSTVTDSYGKVTTFTYDSGGLFYTITGPFGQVTTVNLNSDNLISSIVNPKGETYQFTYKTGTDLLETFTKPGGQVNTFTYSTSGKLTKDQGNGGDFWSLAETLGSTSRTTSTSSAVGRTSTTDSSLASGINTRISTTPFGFVTQFSSGILSGASTESSALSTITRTTTGDKRFVNKLQVPSTTSVQIGSTTSSITYSRVYDPVEPLHYSSFNSVTDTSTVSGRTSTNTFQKSTLSNEFTSSQGLRIVTSVNSKEDLVSYQLGYDTSWSYAYNTLGQLTQISQGSFNTVTNTYDTSGYLDTSTNARGEVTSYDYDLAGRLIGITRPDSKTITFGYDSNGNLTKVVPPNNFDHLFEVNAMELPSKYDPPALTGLTVKETLLSYNLDRQLTSIVRPDMQSALLTYGASTGLLDKITLSRGDNLITYQANTDLVSRIDSADGIRSDFSYYGARIQAEEQKRASDGFSYAKIQYGFDNDHRKVSRGIRGNYPLFSTISTTLNGNNQPTQIGSMVLTYDTVSGRRIGTWLGNISDQRTYDSLGNLDTYTATYTPTSGSPQILYSYDLDRDVMSRIVGKTETIGGVTSTYVYSYDVLGRLTGVTKNGTSISSYVYDDNGNRTGGVVAGTSISATYDAQDRLLTYNGRTHSYNANGDNIQIQWTPTTQSTFSYDALGKLLTATTPLGASLAYSMDGKGNTVRIINGGTTLTRYIYDDQSRIAGEFTDAGVMWRQYLYIGNNRSPDFIIDGTGTIRVIKDHLGTPRLFVKITDGTVMQRMDFDEFGRETYNSNPTYQPFGFAGGLYLRLPGLVRFGQRYYDPLVGRWTTKDPILFEGGSAGLYTYVDNDPINFIDADGNMKLPADPSGLPEEWIKDPKHKPKNGGGLYCHNGDRKQCIEFHPGRPGAKGDQAVDHWHDWRDKDGDKHLFPGDEIPDGAGVCPEGAKRIGSGSGFSSSVPMFLSIPVFNSGFGGSGRAYNVK